MTIPSFLSKKESCKLNNMQLLNGNGSRNDVKLEEPYDKGTFTYGFEAGALKRFNVYCNQ